MTDDAAAQIAELRARIDDADEDIAAAVARRRELSARIQQVRRESGGPAREPSRESVVVDRCARLGRGGADLGRAVLEACLPPGS